MDELQEKYDVLDNRLAALDTKNDEFADTYDCELTELGDEIDNLKEVILFIQEGQVSEESLAVIKDVVVEEMSRRLANG
jgi:hypothetical protein